MGAAQAMSGVLAIEVTLEKGADKLGKLSFTSPIVKIGRGPENDIALGLDPRVSRFHAEIQQHGSEFFVVNVSQKNFILLNGRKVEKERLSPGDRLQVGDTLLRVHYAIPKEKVDIDLSSATMPAMVNRPASGPPQAQGIPVAPPTGTPLSPIVQATPGAIQRPVPPNAIPPMGYVPPRGGPSGPAYSTPPAGFGGGDNKRARFYIVIAVLGIVGYLIFSDSGSKPKKDPNAMRSNTQLLKELQSSEQSIGRLKEEQEKKNSQSYRRAEENLVRAFRDYNNGQFFRAMEGFQVVLSLDPSNEMARRYFNLSRTKLDQQVKNMMLQGARYRDKGNWRLCADAFGKAMVMLQGRRDDPTYLEAKRFNEECRLEMEGRY